jgi:hypothetical protein
MADETKTEYGTYYEQHRPPWGCTHGTGLFDPCGACLREWMEWERGTEQLRALAQLNKVLSRLDTDLYKAGLFGTMQKERLREYE